MAGKTDAAEAFFDGLQDDLLRGIVAVAEGGMLVQILQDHNAAPCVFFSIIRKMPGKSTDN